MTIPRERYRSVQRTREFLESLVDPKQTPRVPREIRTYARCCLRHFPKNFDMEEIAEKLPESWAK